MRRRDGDVSPAALAAAARGSGDAAARCLQEEPKMGSDRPGVHAARNDECESIARGGGRREGDNDDLETEEDYCTLSGVGGRSGLGEARRRAAAAEGHGTGSGGHPQEQLEPSGVDGHSGLGSARRGAAVSKDLRSASSGHIQPRRRQPRGALRDECADLETPKSSSSSPTSRPSCSYWQTVERPTASVTPRVPSAAPLGSDSSSHPQARLRRPHGSTSAWGPAGRESGGGVSRSDSFCAVGSPSDSICISHSSSSREPVKPLSCAAQRDAPHHGHRAERAATTGGDSDLEVANGAARPLAAAGRGTGSHGGRGGLHERRPVLGDLAKERRQRETWDCAQDFGLEGDGSVPAAAAGGAKRRRIRGKQAPSPWVATARTAASGSNSLHEARSVGPSRSTSAYSDFEGDRRAACGDRHGQTLESASAAPTGACGAGGVYDDNGLQGWSTRRGRPPDAD